MADDRSRSGGHVLRDIPVGIKRTGKRRETDTLGTIEVPADRYWGARTQRARVALSIGSERLPNRLYRCYGYVKKGAAMVNAEAGRLSASKAEALIRAADELIAGALDEHFPLMAWQSGSGSQASMNVNEVLANRAIQLLGGVVGSQAPVHPVDDADMCQSADTTFPAAMKIAIVFEFEEHLMPRANALAAALEARANACLATAPARRARLQDAPAAEIGKEWAGYVQQLHEALAKLDESEGGLHEISAGHGDAALAAGGSADFCDAIARKIAMLTRKPFINAPNEYAAETSLDAIVSAMAAVRGLAVALMKIAGDLRMVLSGSDALRGERLSAAADPAASNVAGMVDRAQFEAMIMVCIQVIAEDNAVASAASQARSGFNAMRPLVIRDVLNAAHLLGDACEVMRRYSIGGQLARNQKEQQ